MRYANLLKSGFAFMTEVQEHFVERRKDGWTWTKEIVGTIVGVAMVMAMPTAYLINTLHQLQTKSEVQDTEIKNLKDKNQATESRQAKVDDKIDKVLEAINDVRIQQARNAAGIK